MRLFLHPVASGILVSAVFWWCVGYGWSAPASHTATSDSACVRVREMDSQAREGCNKGQEAHDHHSFNSNDQ